jgi:hypothetical protein
MLQASRLSAGGLRGCYVRCFGGLGNGGNENVNVEFRTSLATTLRYGSAESAGSNMAQNLTFWVTTASVGVGTGILFLLFVVLKQLVADDDPD